MKLCQLVRVMKNGEMVRMGDFGKGLSAFKKGVGAQEETPPAQAGQPGDAAKPISAQATTTPPPSGSQVHQDSAAKV